MSVSDLIFSSERESAAALSTAFVVSSRLSSGTYFKMSKSFCNSWSVKYSYSSRTGLFSRCSYSSEYYVLFPSRFLLNIKIFCKQRELFVTIRLRFVFVLFFKCEPSGIDELDFFNVVLL